MFAELDRHPEFAIFNIVFALALGALMFVAVVILSKRDPAFLQSRYRRWLAYSVLFAVVLPPLVYLLSPFPSSLADAYLLRGPRVHWNRVLDAYVLLVGLLLGGLVGAVINRERHSA